MRTHGSGEPPVGLFWDAAHGLMIGSTRSDRAVGVRCDWRTICAQASRPEANHGLSLVRETRRVAMATIRTNSERAMPSLAIHAPIETADAYSRG